MLNFESFKYFSDPDQCIELVIVTGTSSGDDDGDVEDVSSSGSTSQTPGVANGGGPGSDLDEIASNFDDDALKKINDCWQDKLKDLDDALEYYEETRATWETKQGQSSINPDWAAVTFFQNQQKWCFFRSNSSIG